MGHWLTRPIPVYKVYLAWLALLLVLFIAAIFFQPRFGKKPALSAATRSEIRSLGWRLEEYLEANGRLPAGANAAIMATLSAEGTNPPAFLSVCQTNAQGEAIDRWQSPFQIQIAGTNFVIRSAGPDKITGDADDLIFNSAANDFVTP
jgi:hypothetical protein